jgi:DtxR family Mn-dependent transcriptional regulator
MRRDARAAYLEVILGLTRGGQPARTRDVADNMGLRPSAAEKMMQTLKREALIVQSPGAGALLTEAGRAIALTGERRHRLLEAFLVEVLGMGAGQAHREARAAERDIPEAAADQICAYLEHPGRCPDDRADAADPAGHTRESALRSLCELDEAEAGRIRVVIASAGTRHDLMSLGFLPDVEVSVRRKLRSDSLLVRVKGADIAIGSNVARGILVVPAGHP